MIDDIEKGTGKFDLNKQYIIKNPTDEDIVVTWGAKEPEARGAGTYTIRAGGQGGPYPQFLAYHIVKELVNRQMQKDRKPIYNSVMRTEYENKYLQEVEAGVDLSESIREEERAKLLAEMKTQPIAEGQITSSETRRKALGKKSHTDEEEFKGANR